MSNAPLNAENLDVYATKEGILLDTTVLGYLRSSGYPVNGIESLHTVVGDSGTAHIVMKIETTEKPKDDPELDVVEHETTATLCDCWAFRSNEWPDLREFGNSPNDAGACKHIQQVFKEERAANDENQEELL